MGNDLHKRLFLLSPMTRNRSEVFLTMDALYRLS
jgi:hypothetical protein